MAIHPLHHNPTLPIASPSATTSDYGSDIDIDDATADQLFSQLESQSRSQSPLKATAILPSIEQPAIAELEEDVYTHNFSVRLARLQQSMDGVEESRARLERVVQRRQRQREQKVEVEYDERNRREFSPSNAEEPDVAPEPKKTKKKDTRSPLQRFKARRPLSVTNLVSPAWCEQQYEYNLANFGRIPPTSAMSAGSTVHKALEEQVHVEVPVEVETREDRFGVKLWNTIQGVRALRETGLTRELEVWGVLDGEVVNGIIDEVTMECPDLDMEARMLQQKEDARATNGKGKNATPQVSPDQRTLTEFLTSPSQHGSLLENHPAFLGTLSTQPPTTTYYIKDIKTTARTTPPTGPAYTRGAHLQLMLYHRLLSLLAADQVPAQQIFDRYNLDAQARFSDKFLADLASMDMRAFASVSEEMANLPSSQHERDPLAEVLEFNALGKLWELLVRELGMTFPAPPAPSEGSVGNGTATTSPPSLSPLLTVEYRRSSRTRSPDPAPPTSHDKDSNLIGRRSFTLDPAHLSSYLRSELAWWRGQRPTEGVSVEEAWKCGWCEFREGCAWRRERLEEGLERVRLRREGLGRSGV